MNVKKIRSVNVAYGKTINLGNYESSRIDMGISIDLDKDDNEYEGALEDIFEQLKIKVDALTKEEKRK